MDEFMMHLRWLAEQRRLQDLEYRRQKQARIAFWEVYFYGSDDDQDLEVIEDGESEGNEASEASASD